MADLVLSRPTAYVTKRAASWVLSKVSKRLQQRFFPNDLSKLQFRFVGVPDFYVYGESTHSSLGFTLEVSNFSPYHTYAILAVEAEAFFSKRVGTLSCHQFLELPPSSQGGKLRIRTYWNAGQTAEAIASYRQRELKNVSFHMNMTLLTPFGLRRHEHRCHADVRLSFRSD